MSARVYLFQKNVSVLYGMTLWTLELALTFCFWTWILYMNIVNHYQDAAVLESALQAYDNVYSSLDPLVVTFYPFL
jgi:hypothetical protein